MISHFRDLFGHVRLRPGMYGVQTYAETASFVTGCDAATGWLLLEGFHEWLMVQLDAESSLTWSALILELTLGTERPSARQLSAEAEAAAHDRLFDLLDQFLAVKEQRDGLRQVFAAYSARRAEWDALLAEELDDEDASP
ncbi:hypothetical protein [Catellatospora chokoriensis]|uniref:hypothetical protein n=1 Tax=Catellatospora chokoriensis TaxID=310353 RepID=UPI0017847378|nr:hypothetical protein [Catellatospora chokoriensis]